MVLTISAYVGSMVIIMIALVAIMPEPISVPLPCLVRPVKLANSAFNKMPAKSNFLGKNKQYFPDKPP